MLQNAWPQPVVPEFGEAMQITDTNLASLLARSPKGSFMFDSQGTLHLVYTEKNAEGTSLGNPGLMLYRNYRNGQWTEPLAIRSSAGEGIPFINGGEPALWVEDDQTVHFVFHDYRHSTSSSGTNQVEVYYRKLLPTGEFVSDEIRISDNEKNSWRPKIIMNQNGQLVIVWYDFSQSTLGDMMLAISDPNQHFPETNDFASQVVANANPTGEGVQLPNAAFDSAGRLHAVWTAAELDGFTYVNESLIYGVLENPASRTITQRQEVSSRGTLSTDPAKIRIDHNDTIWVVWTDLKTQIPNIFLAAKTIEQSAFSDPMPISDNDLPDAVGLADIAVDPNGLVYIVWTDYRTGEGDIYLRIFDSVAQALSDITPLTTDDFNVDERPGIAISPNGQVSILWESKVEGRTNLMMLLSENGASVRDWMWLR
ncbi:MAG: hypothetical protein C4527_04595 [Candidatus Omnitrophota bacterium]|nr:MAG: hypothetical protein C4527_04595 [Candidatus Omnitrophota bacterium]